MVASALMKLYPLQQSYQFSRQAFNVALLLLFSYISCFSASVLASNRIALVMGNSAYQDMPLKNPRNDAQAMKRVLEQASFEVISALDADLPTMQQAMLSFVSKLDEDSTALVFYAGHGMQANGRNYLLPVDIELESERALRFQALELGDLLEELDSSRARIKMVILDACRNNPFERKLRGMGRGLAAVDAARGTLIAYATSPGATASDGDGDNGLYTQSLLTNILQPGLKVEEVFKKVRISVSEASDGAQIPWESSSLTGDFVFIDRRDETAEFVLAAKSAISSVSRPGPEERAVVDHEALYWQSVQNSNDSALFQAYLEKYPDGHFADLAKLKQLEIQKRLKAERSKQSLKPVVKSDSMAKPSSNSCSDLSGLWRNTPASTVGCAPKEFRFSRTAANSYEVRGTGCGAPLTATALYKPPSTLVANWKMATCTGTTTYAFDDDCTVAKGEVVVDRHLLCLVKDTEETIDRIE